MTDCTILEITRLLTWLGLGLVLIVLTFFGLIIPPFLIIIVPIGIVLFLLTYYLIIKPLEEAEHLYKEGKKKEAQNKLIIPIIVEFITGNTLGFILVLISLLICE